MSEIKTLFPMWHRLLHVLYLTFIFYIPFFKSRAHLYFPYNITVLVSQHLQTRRTSSATRLVYMDLFLASPPRSIGLLIAPSVNMEIPSFFSL